MSEYQAVINLVAGILIAAGGWFARTLWDAVQELKTDLGNLRVEIAKDYVPRNDFNRLGDELKEMLKAIFEKLDHKADK
jgi:hypothetical protein